MPDGAGDGDGDAEGVVDTAPGSEMRRMRLFCVSPTIRNAPPGPTAAPMGLVNWALVPLPSKNPTEEPASVLTSPAGVMARTQWLEFSVTYRMLPPSRATPVGLLNAALVPRPFVSAGVPEPANVLTKPAGVMALMR